MPTTPATRIAATGSSRSRRARAPAKSRKARPTQWASSGIRGAEDHRGHVHVDPPCEELARAVGHEEQQLRGVGEEQDDGRAAARAPHDVPGSARPGAHRASRCRSRPTAAPERAPPRDRRSASRRGQARARPRGRRAPRPRPRTAAPVHLGSTPGQHEMLTLLRRAFAQLRQETRLARPGLAADRHPASFRPPQLLERSGQGRQLLATPHEGPCSAALRLAHVLSLVRCDDRDGLRR